MKYVKLVPVLAATLLLSACGDKAISAKKPSFAKEGNEIQFEAFVEAMNKEDLLGFFSSGDPTKLESYSAKGTLSVEQISTRKAGEKVKAKETDLQVSSMDLQDDIEHRVVKMNETIEQHLTGKGPSSEYEQTDKMGYDMTYQVSDVEGKKSFVGLLESEKIYAVAQDLTSVSEDDITLIFQQLGFSAGTEFISPDWSNDISPLVAYWDTTPEEMRAKYKFFQNGEIYTVIYQEKVTDELKDSNDQLVSSSELTMEYKYQLDISKGASFKSKTSKVEKSVIKFEQDTTYNGTQYYAGESLEQENNSYFDAAVQVKKLNLKAVDLSKYTKRDSL